MGVSGLFSFANANSSSNVRFSEEVTLAHSCGRDLLIICDGPNLLQKLLPTSLSSVHGGQWTEYKNNIRRFVYKFRALGISLIFVFDGKVDEEKKAVWFQRRKREHIENCRILENFHGYDNIIYHKGFHCVPSTLQESTALILKDIGVDVLFSFGDADAEVAFQAVHRKAMGIISDDSDFLVYNCGCPIYTVSNLNMVTKTATKILSCDLCENLDINLCDLPLLACLLGNDRIHPLSLTDFHQRISQERPGCGVKEKRIRDVARFIVTCNQEKKHLFRIAQEAIGEEHSDLFIGAIAQYVLPMDSSPWLIHSTIPSIKEYKSISCPWRPAVFPPDLMDKIDEKSEVYGEDFIKKILDLHATGDISHHVYTILLFNLYQCCSSLEDNTLTDIPSIREIYAVLRKNIYSFVLSQFENSVVTEWHGDKYAVDGVVENIVNVTPLQTTGQCVPCSIKDLCFLQHPDQSRNPQLCMLFELCSCSDLQPKMQQFLSIPSHLRVLCILLHYLLCKVNHRPFLNPEEIDPFIAQVLVAEKHDAKTIRKIKIVPRPRAINLASIFVRGLAVIRLANAVCGSPLHPLDFAPNRLFDGAIFAKKYMNAIEGNNSDLNVLLGTNVSCAMLF